MNRRDFEQLVQEALESIPDEIHARLDNIDVLVEDWPTREQLMGTGLAHGEYLLGLYEGIPLTERYGYDMVLPDRITIFQKSIEAICQSNEDIVREVRDTVVHEIGHYFGIDDERMEELGV